MKICVVSSTVFSVGTGPGGLCGYGGLEVIAWECARGLAERGHDVSLVAPDGSTCPGVTIIPCGPERQVNESMAYGGFPEVKEKRGDAEVVLRQKHPGYWQHLLDVDCVICHDWEKWPYMLKAEGQLKAPILCVLHAPANTMFGSPPPVEKPCIVAISQDQANHWNALHDRPDRPCPAKVCYNGVSADHYKPLDISRTNRFLFLARFSSIKGGDLAIDACRKAGAELDLVGDTTITGEPQYLIDCARKCDYIDPAAGLPGIMGTGNGRRIAMRGPCTRGNTVWWMSQSFAMLHLNKRFREPFGLAPIESQLCGLPVIGWDYGAMRETVKDLETGWLVYSLDEATALVTHLKQNGVPDIMRKRAREWASGFSIKRMVARYEDLATIAVETGGW